MTKYVPYITVLVDDEYGVQRHTEYDSDNMFDTYEEALEELEEVKEESDDEYGILEIEDGEIVKQWVESEEDYNEPDDRFLEVDFNPYSGQYEYDYESETGFGEEW